MNKEEARKINGRKLKEIRMAKGMSQEELAKALGYTNRSSINKIEIGRSSMPIEKVQKAAEVLGVSPLELFNEVENFINNSVKATSTDTPGLDPDFLIRYEALSDKNKEQAKSYIEFLLETQGGDKE